MRPAGIPYCLWFHSLNCRVPSWVLVTARLCGVNFRSQGGEYDEVRRRRCRLLSAAPAQGDSVLPVGLPCRSLGEGRSKGFTRGSRRSTKIVTRKGMAIGGRRSMPQWRSSSSAVTFSMALPEFDVRIAERLRTAGCRCGDDRGDSDLWSGPPEAGILFRRPF